MPGFIPPETRIRDAEGNLETKIIETTSKLNWGKFMLCRFDAEWRARSAVSGLGMSLLREIGWGPQHLWVLDLQTGEGAFFLPHRNGSAKAELNRKHRIWVCPMFESFLEWLYQQDLTDLQALPALVELSHAEFALYGYRREGVPESEPKG